MPELKGRGGPGRGQGRKKRSDRYGGAIVAAEDACRDRLPQTLANIEKIADGRTVQVEEKSKPAGTIFRKDVVRDPAGHPIADSKGRFVSIEVLSYPDLDAAEMVVVERKETHYPEDLPANAYLADRVLGKVTPADDVPGDAEDGEPAPFDLDLLTDEDYAEFERLCRIAARRQLGPGPSGPGPAADPP